jgi:ComF family protein
MIKSWIQKFKKSKISLPSLLGNFCLICHVWHNELGLCKSCLKKLPWNTECCQRCAYPLTESQACCGQCLHMPEYLRIRAVFRYQAPLNWMVGQFKYANKLVWGGCLEKLMVDGIQVNQLPQAILPIPSNKIALAKRGFNPTMILAKSFSSRYNIPIIQPFLCIKDQPLARLKRAKRLQAAKTMFVQTKAIPQQRVMVIDDILTTGATAVAMAQRLKYAGVIDVQHCVLARAIIN